MEDHLKISFSILKQTLTTVLSVSDTDNLVLDKLPSEKAKWLRAKLVTVDEHGRKIRDALSDSLYNNHVPLVRGSGELVAFYENEYLPRAACISSLVSFGHTRGLDLDSMLAELGIDLSSSRPLTFRSRNPFWTIFENGLDQLDMLIELNEEEYTQHLDEDELAHARKLLNSEYFRPDDWAENLDALTPILTSRTVDKIPSHVRLRVREVYASFVFGNSLSVLSSGRALLEYALLDRHSPLGFVAYETREGSESATPLSLMRLIENASEKLPELNEHMELIQSYGNEVMHPRKTKKITVPPAGRIHALDCIVRLRAVLQRLYA